MRLCLAAAVLLLLACGGGRDATFTRIVQFSAVEKLQQADGFIYFTEGSALKRVAIKNGLVESLLPNGVVDFAVTNGHVFAATTDGVMHQSTTGEPEKVSPHKALSIAADGHGVSWLTCTTVTHASLDGVIASVNPVLGQCGNANTRLTLDSSTAYGQSADGIWWASRSGGPIKYFSTRQCNRVGAGGGWFYCATLESLSRLGPLTGQDEEILTGQVRDFAIGASRIYAARDSELVSMPRDGSSVAVLGTYAAISAVALDSEHVYIVNTESGLGLLLSTAL